MTKQEQLQIVNAKIDEICAIYGDSANKRGKRADIARDDAFGVYQAIEQQVMGWHLIEKKLNAWERQQLSIIEMLRDEGDL